MGHICTRERPMAELSPTTGGAGPTVMEKAQSRGDIPSALSLTSLWSEEALHDVPRGKAHGSKGSLVG